MSVPLDPSSRRLLRFILTTVWVGLALTGAAVVVGITYVTVVSWNLFSGNGPLHASSPPPFQFERMVKTAQAADSHCKYASLGGFLDEDYAWRIPVRPSRLDSVAAEVGLEEQTTAPPRSAWRAFPSQWSPDRRHALRVFWTRDFPFEGRGDDGEHYFAVYDSQTSELWVWLKSNF